MLNVGVTGPSPTINSFDTPSTPSAISGNFSPCQSATGVIYSVANDPTASSYNWSVPSGATIVSGQGSNSITIDWGATSGNVQVNASNACGTSGNSSSSISLQSIPAVPGAISGNSSPCRSATGVSYSISAVSGAISYNWIIPTGATITSGQGTTSITVNWGINSGDVTVSASNSCGTSGTNRLTVTLIDAPVPPGVISGNTAPCINATSISYSISAVSGATNYTWSVPSGATIISGQGSTTIAVNWGTTSGDVRVVASNTCGSSAQNTLSVTLQTAPGTPTEISGNLSPCINQSGVSYSCPSVSGATSYIWSVPSGASIVGGQGTNSITVNWGSTSGTISVFATNACGNSSAQNVTATLQSPPSALSAVTGNSSPCSGASGVAYSVTSSPGITYNWTVPAGATIASGTGSPSITVNWGTSSGNVSVTGTNDCGTTSPSTLSVTLGSTPGTPGAISGNTSPCVNATVVSYSIAAVSGASSYSWSVPSGASITSGNGNTSITVNWGSTSGNVLVSASNSCGGSGQSSLSVSVQSAPSSPSSISGITSACGGTSTTYSIANVPGATSYTWTVPSGTTINSGHGSTSINVTFGNSSGNVTVLASNACGSSSSTSKAVTVSPVPSTPVALQGTQTSAVEFLADWNGVAGATNYYLDVSQNNSFSSFEGPYNAWNTGSNTQETVLVGTCNRTFYYRVRAGNSCGTSGYSNTITMPVACPK